MTDVLDQHIDRGVMVLTMNRPRRRNAVDQELADALDAAFTKAEADPEVRVVVLTGAGGYFSAGTDLSAGGSPKTPEGGEYGFVRRTRSVPVIAAVEGFALGGGLEMVLACDMAVVAEDAQLGLPEVKRGLVANCGALFRTPYAVPPVVATEMLLTGDSLTAEQAAAYGLINRVVPSGQALAAACELAGRITANGPTAVAETTKAMLAARAQREAADWPLTEAASAAVKAGPDAAEGIAAFFEKRPPSWQLD